MIKNCIILIESTELRKELVLFVKLIALELIKLGCEMKSEKVKQVYDESNF
jgi:hypothetical protein